jgi:hypothetical protein
MKDNTNDQNSAQGDRHPYLNDNSLDEDKIFIEIPAEQRPVDYERLPSGFDPMGEIYLRGRAYRGISGGRTPWWVLISGWIIFGGIFVLCLSAAFVSQSIGMIFPLLLSGILVLIVLRGTLAKLSHRQHRRR